MTNQYTHHVPPVCDEELVIRYQDDAVLVIEKPAGLLSVPGRFVKDCAVSRLMVDFPELKVVHRLDLDTSGLMMFALSDVGLKELMRQFREKQVRKTYCARVYGIVSKEEGTIDAAIARNWENRPRQVIDTITGKEAVTHYQVVCRDEITGSTRLTLTPETGRSHQLRIHLAHIHHPILGCDLYAHEAALAMADRLMLHATALEFCHPLSGSIMHITSAAPF